MSINVQTIRENTRLALPDDDEYLFRLGVALYGFSSINSFMTEIITYLDPATSRTELDGLMSGEVLNRFRQAVKRWTGPDISQPAKQAAKEFERLNTERSDFVHAYPVTSPAGEQILHRRVEAKGKFFEVTTEFLDDFISRLHTVSTDLYEIRAKVRSNL